MRQCYCFVGVLPCHRLLLLFTVDTQMRMAQRACECCRALQPIQAAVQWKRGSAGNVLHGVAAEAGFRGRWL